MLKTLCGRITAATLATASVGAIAGGLLLADDMSVRRDAAKALRHAESRAAVVQAAFALSLERNVSQVTTGLPI